MTKIRFGLFIVMIVGAIYAAAGLMTSLRDFGIGIAVVALAVLCQGLLTYIHDHEIACERDRVWARRDQ